MKKTDIQQEIESLHTKLDRLLTEIDEIKNVIIRQPASKKKKHKAVNQNLSVDTQQLKDEFTNLFNLWLSGKEIEVKEMLEGYTVEKLRLIADANNLNVTSRTPKQKVLFLISARFREKKQLVM